MEHELSDFTKLVLARMVSNPDEFEPNSRWDNLVRGLEEYARGDTEGRYVKTLWALEPIEIDTLLDKYRRVYLARLHKQMLKNIVSGNDLGPSPEQTYQAGIGKQASQGVLRGTGPGAVTLPADMYGANRYEFVNDASATVSVAPTSTLQLGGTKLTEGDVKKLKKILVTHTDVKMATKFGLSIEEYIKRRDAE